MNRVISFLLTAWIALVPCLALADGVSAPIAVSPIGHQGAAVQFPPQSASSTTTLDPSFLISGVTLSNGNLTASYTTTSNNIVRSVASHTSGKYYWEETITTTGTPVLGIVSDTEVDTNYISQTSKSAGIYAGSGWLSNACLSGIVTAPTANVSGHTFGFALDATSKLIWVLDITAGTGQWNANATANPATGVNGTNFSSCSDLGTAAIHAGQTMNTSGDHATFNFGGSAYAGTPPSGFGNM